MLQEFVVTLQASKSKLNHNLRAILGELQALGTSITGAQLSKILARTDLSIDDVAAFATPNPDSYSRRRIARTECFEVLVMTWLPGQGSGPHDHAGSVSAFKILRGTAHETRHVQAADGLVDPIGARQLHESEAGVDQGGVIHSVRNESETEPLVSIHIYAPPIRELRAFTRRTEAHAPAEALVRGRSPCAPVVAIVGGGYSGAMVAVQLVHKTARSGTPMHIVILDGQASIAEGVAYRTPDPRHLLNVPASNMSAWHDRSDDFLKWARQRDSTVSPYSFVSRRAYGEYLRATFLNEIAQAGPQTSVEIRRQVADSIERGGARGWRIDCQTRESIEADVVVLATGHRSPIDPLSDRWYGSRARYLEDPWSSPMLAAIEPDESVCLLGTGLTAIDVLQSLGGPARRAPVTAFSRRGLLPATHAGTPLTPLDPRDWLEPLLRAGTGVTTRALTRGIRRAVRLAEARQDWRQVIDGLRPHISAIWGALNARDRSRFLRHARAFWEVRRHRMAPTVGEEVREAARTGIFSVAAARPLSARGDLDGATLTVRRRGESVPELLRFDWIVNCTGPGSGREFGLPSSVARLIDAGDLEEDPLGLGVRSTPNGQAAVDGRVIEDLVIIGSLRKADLWESTAVPELRLQAAAAADAIIELVNRPSMQSGGGHRGRAVAYERSFGDGRR